MITLLTGPDNYAAAEFIDTKRRAFTGEVISIDGSVLEAAALPDVFTGTTLFSTARLVIIRDASRNKSIWTVLDDWVERIPAETDVIFVDEAADKRTRTYKQLQKHGKVIDCKLPSTSQVATWAKAYVSAQSGTIPPPELGYLVGLVGTDRWRLKGELDKLLLAKRPINRQLIDEIVEPNPEASVFRLLEAIFRGERSKAEDLFATVAQKEDPYKFFGLVSSQVIAMLAILSAGSRRRGDIAREQGISPYILDTMSPIAERLGLMRCRDIAARLAVCDEKIKTTGVEPWHQLRVTLLSL
ncbi:MAG TPA: DNA polymerase III subunit delta [Candidatus Saccharimonadales bacterium]|jgi:DNA polymerase-3 subunit delta